MIQSQDLDEIKEQLRNNPDLKWGFVIYRCTYSDDSAWAKFMNRLNVQARGNLKSYEAKDLFSRIDWSVQEDPSLDNASPSHIRDLFKEWIQTNYPQGGGGARTFGCIMVDKTSLDTLDGEYAGLEDEFDSDGMTWVWMVSAYSGVKRAKVGISYILPRVYILLDTGDWSFIQTEDQSVATP